jgi:hypothetical protein
MKPLLTSYVSPGTGAHLCSSPDAALVGVRPTGEASISGALVLTEQPIASALALDTLAVSNRL